MRTGQVKQWVFGGVWAASLAAAFLLGRSAVVGDRELSDSAESTEDSGFSPSGESALVILSDSDSALYPEGPIPVLDQRVVQGSDVVLQTATTTLLAKQKGSHTVESVENGLVDSDTLSAQSVVLVPTHWEQTAARRRQLEKKGIYPLSVLRSLLENPGTFDNKMVGALNGLLQEEMPAAAKLLDEMDWNYQTERVLQRVLQQWTGFSPHDAIAYAASLDGLRMKDSAMRTIMNAWVDDDPNRAVAYADGLEPGHLRNSLLEKVAGEWGKDQPEDAWNWFSTSMRTDDSLPASRIKSLFKSLAYKDSGAALGHASSISNADYRKTAMQTVIDGMMDQGKQVEVASLYRSTTSSTDRDLIARSVADSWERYQPRLAAEWTSVIADKTVRNQAVSSLVSEWSRDHPAEAAEWVMKLDDPDVVKRELSRVTKNWATHDLIDATEWLTGLPASPKTDPAVESLARSVLLKDPEMAMELAEGISVEKRRHQAIVRLGRQLAETDATQAWSYLLKSSLPPERLASAQKSIFRVPTP